MTRQVEVLNDNILGNKMNHTKIESLSGNSVVDASQLNQLQNYLHESNEKNQQLLDTVGILKDEIIKGSNINNDLQNQKIQLKYDFDILTKEMIENNEKTIEKEKKRLQEELLEKQQQLEQQQQQQESVFNNKLFEIDTAIQKLSKKYYNDSTLSLTHAPKSSNIIGELQDDLSTINYAASNSKYGGLSTVDYATSNAQYGDLSTVDYNGSSDNRLNYKLWERFTRICYN